MQLVNLTNGNKLADRQVVDKVLSGDTQAFGIIIKCTEGLVAQIAFKMVAHTEDRKDLIQDIYLKVFKNLGSFRFESKLLTWIGHIAFNTCANYLEKKKLLLTGLPGNDDNKNNSEVHVPDGSETMLSQKELKAILAVNIEKLSPLYKTIIGLYHQQEMSYADITDITGLPEGTLKSYLSRARKALKGHILNEYKKEEL
jgi:RNA polymerase sigma factor (sigma-70 family)